MGFKTLRYCGDAVLLGFLTTLSSGVYNTLHASCARTMPLNMNPMTALVFSAFMEFHTTTHHFFGAICRKRQSHTRRCINMLFMNVGGPSYFVSLGLQKGTMGTLGQCMHWMRTPFRSNTRNRIFGKVACRIGGAAALPSPLQGEDR